MRLFGPAPRWDAPTYWALDLETSGLLPGRDQILSVGMLPVRRGAIAWGERYYSLTRPGSFTGLTEEAIAVHHILPQELRLAPELPAVLPAVAERLGGGVLLVHHAPLDVSFLRRAFRRFGLPWPHPRVVDTQRLLARLERRRHLLDPYGRPLPRSLSGARRHFGLPTYDYHHALTDALATAELFLLLRHRLRISKLSQLR